MTEEELWTLYYQAILGCSPVVDIYSAAEFIKAAAELADKALTEHIKRWGE